MQELQEGDDPLRLKSIDQNNFLARLKLRDERALDYVVDTYGGLIQAIVHRHLALLPNRREECINDILLAVWNQIGHFDPQKNSFSGWLAAVSKYKAIDCKRRYFHDLLEAPLPEEAVSPDGNPEESVLAKELSEGTESLLEQLPPEERRLFWDRYVDETPMEELAQERNTNVSALYSRLSRDRKKMKLYKEAK